MVPIHSLKNRRNGTFSPLASLTTPDAVEKSWPELASSRRMFLPLLGERAGVRAGVSLRITSMNRTKLCVESGVLSLRGFLEVVWSCWIVSLIFPRASRYAKPNRAAADDEDFAARLTHIQTVPLQRARPGVATS